ncbi:HAD-IIA family hydrolase [Thermococcus sp.]
MDGVLYRNRSPIPGAPGFIRFLNSRGIPYVLLTNNSTLTPGDYRKKLLSMGMDVPEGRIVTSGRITAIYMEENLENGPVFVIGAMGLVKEIELAGWEIISMEDMQRRWKDVMHVVVGLDPGLTYDKLKYGTLAIRNGATFIGTNPDTTYPAEEGLYPGAGSIIAALKASTDVEPLIVGKPNKPAYRVLRDILGEEEIWMVGDRLDTDIAFAKRFGMKAVMVLTGVSTLEDVEESNLRPDLVVPDVGALVEYLKAGEEDGGE